MSATKIPMRSVDDVDGGRRREGVCQGPNKLPRSRDAQSRSRRWRRGVCDRFSQRPQIKNSGVWFELAITAKDVCGEERLADAVVG